LTRWRRNDWKIEGQESEGDLYRGRKRGMSFQQFITFFWGGKC
jgi:hypothetical protein